MNTLSPTKFLLTFAVIGVVTGAIMTSSVQSKKVTFRNGTVVEASKYLAAAQSGIYGQYPSTWQTLKNKSEGQIRDNDKRIITYKAQRVRASRAFRLIYDKRVAELERRNIALRARLNDYKGDRGAALVESK